MGLAHSPRIVTDGLVFAMDGGNPDKSWKGKPTTNFFTNGHFSGGNGITQESGSNATNEVVVFPNPGETDYVLRQTGTVNNTEYQINLTTELSASTTYVMSGWYAESPDYSSANGSRMFHSRAFSAGGNHVALGTGIGTVLETRVVNGITWKYCYATITTPSDYSDSFNWYMGYGSASYTGHRYYTNIQMEEGTLPSRFVNGTRSNTQAIKDLTGQNTVTVQSMTYNSDGTFEFDGSTDNFIIPTIDFSTAQTVEIWMKPTESDGSRRNPYNQAYGGFGTWTHETDGSINAYFGTAGGNGSPYVNRNSGTNGKVLENETACMCFTRDTSTTAWYKNGVQVATSTNPYGTLAATSANITIGDGYATAFKGSIFAVKLYTRALSAEEVAQNFNALRGRYGI